VAALTQRVRVHLVQQLNVILDAVRQPVHLIHNRLQHYAQQHVNMMCKPGGGVLGLGPAQLTPDSVRTLSSKRVSNGLQQLHLHLAWQLVGRPTLLR
jgi:hypothetical protein